MQAAIIPLYVRLVLLPDFYNHPQPQLFPQLHMQADNDEFISHA
jgi:hypothetical protein